MHRRDKEQERERERVNSVYKNSNYFIKRRDETAAVAGATCTRGDCVIQHLHGGVHVCTFESVHVSLERVIARMFTLARVLLTLTRTRATCAARSRARHILMRLCAYTCAHGFPVRACACTRDGRARAGNL